MKVVYVGDNRNRYNYGCRATSTALSQLISKEHTIVGRIHGNFRNSDTRKLFYSPLVSRSMYERLGELKHWEIIKEFIVDFTHIRRRMRVAFTANDFITKDFDESINRLIKCIPANDFLKECDLSKYEYDALVVNGEGSFIFSQRPWRESMVETLLMYWAKKMKKKVYFLNGMFSGSPGEDLNLETISLMKPIFEAIDFVGVRESESYKFAKEYFPNANIGLYPDALFSWSRYINDEFTINNGRYVIGFSEASDESLEKLDFSKPYICVSGSSANKVTKDLETTIAAYVDLINALKESTGINVYIVIPCEIDNFLIEVGHITNTQVIPVDTPVLSAAKILANARAYVTGRYHPAILASQGGTPCVFLGANSQKNRSLQTTLEYDSPYEYNAVPTKDDICSIIKETQKFINQGEHLRNKISERAKVLGDMASNIAEVIK